MPSPIGTKRGFFFVLEGLDRSGKSTQIEKLVQYLEQKNRPVYETHFPARETQTGKMLDAYLRNKSETTDEAVHLLFSANRWEKAHIIRRKVEQEGQWIVCSRYAYSGVAYTCAKGTKSLEWGMGPDRGLPLPDIVIYLTMDPQAATGRSDYGEERYENTSFQHKVKNIFDQLFDQDPRVVRIDATQSIDDVHAAIVAAVEERWEVILQNSASSIGDLWA